MRAAVFGLVAAALLGHGAKAQTMSDSMLPVCREGTARHSGPDPPADTAMDLGVCLDGLFYGSTRLPSHMSVCPPQNVTTGHTVRVVIAYIERRPERMHEDFRGLALEAIHEAWPCR